MNYLAEDSKEVMSRHGKSFYFASLIFSEKSLSQVSSLYAFCRYVDDCADELSPSESKLALQNIRAHLENRKLDSELQDYLKKLESFGVQRFHMNELLLGAEFDASGKKVETEDDLIRYCYLVAGVVGLMMCPLLGVKDKKAAQPAVALGIGMQLTNICRDVLEDAKNGRIYLPALTLSQPEKLKAIIKDRLEMADKYYVQAYQGLSYIPFRPRLCILIAGEVYRAIGVKIQKNDYNVLQGRTYLNLFEKILVAIKTLPKIFYPSFWRVAS